MLDAANPLAVWIGPGTTIKPARLVGDPLFEQFDLRGVELGPIGIERDDASY